MPKNLDACLKSPEYRLVLIEWLDSYGCSSSWQDLSTCEPGVMTCKSVGWLIHDDEKCKVVVPHMNQPDHPNASQQGCGDMTIPSASIVKILDLGVVGKRRG
jgi:hypothetical protein